jgi:leader peptidase (prepilin peptidase) / N-methyltransferase
MLISRFATIFLVPFIVGMSAYSLLPLSLIESIAGAMFGYFFLFSINRIFKYLRNIDGIGEGDFDLILLIGSCTGILGCWISITIGSIFGSLYGLSSLVLSKHNSNFELSLQNTKIPFGPFLAIGALLFTLFQKQIFSYLMIN